jgi:hypothetical protein
MGMAKKKSKKSKSGGKSRGMMGAISPILAAGGFLSGASAAVSLIHGYYRSGGDALSALAWGLGGAIPGLGLVVPVVALSQGFARPAKAPLPILPAPYAGASGSGSQAPGLGSGTAPTPAPAPAPTPPAG